MFTSFKASSKNHSRAEASRWSRATPRSFCLGKQVKTSHHYKMTRKHTSYPVFLVWTLPCTNSTQWISGVTDDNIAVDEELQEINRFMVTVFGTRSLWAMKEHLYL